MFVPVLFCKTDPKRYNHMTYARLSFGTISVFVLFLTVATIMLSGPSGRGIMSFRSASEGWRAWDGVREMTGVR